MADASRSKHAVDVPRRNDSRRFAIAPDDIGRRVREHLRADPRCGVATVTREEGAGLLSGASCPFRSSRPPERTSR